MLYKAWVLQNEFREKERRRLSNTDKFSFYKKLYFILYYNPDLQSNIMFNN